MLLALVMAASLTNCIPARWKSSDPASLDIVAETPVNCLLLDPARWSATFSEQASKKAITALGVIRPGTDPAEEARRALAAKLGGLVLEGDFDPATVQRLRDSTLPIIELPSRATLRLREPPVILGTSQGIWPGIHVQEDTAKAQPTGGPWIDTNTGFLRFLRGATDAPLWIAYEPPPKTVLPPEHYLHAVCDAALSGARWIVSLDEAFEKRLLAREEAALSSWRRMGAFLRYFEEHGDWRAFRPHGGLSMVQDADSGALLSGSILDMVAAKNIPVRAAPRWRVAAGALVGSKLAVSVDPESLSAEEQESLRAFARSGGTLLSGPPGWRFPPMPKDKLLMGKDDVQKLDEIWRGVNALVGRNNLGARLFNVAGMLSNMLVSPSGKQVVLHLVNYTAYPVEDVTVHLLGSYKRARLISPESPPRDLDLYPIDEGLGVDVPRVRVLATLVLE
jgi:hypothetical protein